MRKNEQQLPAPMHKQIPSTTAMRSPQAETYMQIRNHIL
jgi:hypothetical protein